MPQGVGYSSSIADRVGEFIFGRKALKKASGEAVDDTKIPVVVQSKSPKQMLEENEEQVRKNKIQKAMKSSTPPTQLRLQKYEK